MEDIAVTCTDLKKRYGTRIALDGVTLEIPSGRIVGVLGPNGSGKSTLFRAMMGLTHLEAGTIRIMGAPPGWETNANIAYLPERARWYPGHTVQHAIQWGDALLPHFDRARATQLAKEMQLDLHQKIDGMSRGTEARLMFILCLARQVPLMILDEPFSGIDLISREQIIAALITWVSEQDTTVILSTHEISEAESLFDYIVFLRNGQSVQQGDADELRRAHGSIRDIMRNWYYGEGHRQ